MFELGGKRIWVAGHCGMVGSALMRRLASESCSIITVGREAVDLRRQAAVESFLCETRPDAIILAAARVGGILANSTYPVDFLYDNLMIAANVVKAAHENDVERLLILGSSCIYPRAAAQPIDEAALLSGRLEPSNEFYAIAKIAGLKLVEAYRRQYGRDYIAAMPTNLYGPGDNFDLLGGHVLPALIRKAHWAKVNGAADVTIWGSGRPRREFLHADDCADALVLLLKQYSDAEHVNVGSGLDHTILELAQQVCDVVGFTGSIAHDLSKPDGMPRKLMRADKLRALGWAPRISLERGLRDVYAWFLEHVAEGQAA
jgi:GDP-L-fucose synthase